MSEEKFRIESDLLGELQVPADAYYGVQTQRALNNYKISTTRMCDYPEYVIAMACIKLAAAQTNKCCPDEILTQVRVILVELTHKPFRVFVSLLFQIKSLRVCCCGDVSIFNSIFFHDFILPVLWTKWYLSCESCIQFRQSSGWNPHSAVLPLCFLI